MTNTIVIGERHKVKKPIEFLSLIRLEDKSCHINHRIYLESYTDKPSLWNNIELICKDYIPNLDLMFAYEDPNKRNFGILVIGRWNDGVVE